MPEIDPNAAAMPAAPAQPATNATPVVPPAAAQTNEDPNNPSWLPDRLARERKSAAKEADAAARKALLEELGFGDIEVAKKLAADEKKRAEAQKSLETKVAERDAKLSTTEARLNELNSSVKVFADEQIATLSDPQRKAVLDLAGDDPAKQLKAIATLRPTWGASIPVVPAQVPNGTTPANGAPPVAPIVPPAKPAAPTAPGATAPSPAGATVVPNHLETYEWLEKNKPFAASTYFQVHYAEINEARSKRSN